MWLRRGTEFRGSVLMDECPLQSGCHETCPGSAKAYRCEAQCHDRAIRFSIDTRHDTYSDAPVHDRQAMYRTR